ncbi:MAG: hypothetical protein Q8P75_03220 [bacterium]|nr:hypothetical protein [bacterium]
MGGQAVASNDIPKISRQKDLSASARKPRARPWMKGGTGKAREGKTWSGFGGFRAIFEADKPAAALAKAGWRYDGFSRGAPFVHARLDFRDSFSF